MIRALLLVSAITALAGCGPREADRRGVDRDEVLVQIVASGRAEVRPDEARLVLGVQTQGSSAQDASAANARRMNAVVAALRQQGIGEDDIQTQALGLQRIDYGPERGRFAANNQVQVRIRDVSKAGPAVAAATGVAANLLSGPDLRVADPEAASRAAYANAYRAARARADAYAQAAGLRVARVLAIREGGGGGPQPYEMQEEADLARPVPVIRTAPPPPISPGVSTRDVQVAVDFALAE